MTEPRPTLPSSSTPDSARLARAVSAPAADESEARAELAALAGARGTLYRFLAGATLAPPTREAVAALVDPGYGDVLQELLADGRLVESLAVLRQAPVDLPQLVAEYHRLFSIPGPDQLAPYAAMFDPSSPPEGRLLQGPQTSAVLAAYSAAGYRPARDFDELPDHIGVELSFLASLCDEERAHLAAGDTACAAALATTEQQFIRAHLSWLAPGVATALELRTKSPWFLCIAALLRAFVAAEAGEKEPPDRSGS